MNKNTRLENQKKLDPKLRTKTHNSFYTLQWKQEAINQWCPVRESKASSTCSMKSKNVYQLKPK